MSGLRKGHYRLEVRWEDSTILHGGWYDIGEALSKRDAVICSSVGVVLADDDRGIVLATSVHGGQAAGITVIPRRCIVKRRRLR